VKVLLILLLWVQSSIASMYVAPFGTKFNGRKMGGEVALDLYESYLSFNLDLRKRHTVKDVKGSEWKLYGLMLKNAFVPGYLSVQSSIYPVLKTSTWMEANHKSTFDQFSFSKGRQNWMSLLSANFTDPYAFSVFLGELIDFRKQIQGKPPQSGYGLMGYVITYGPLSSYRNQLIWDNWYELKWKIKGLKEYEQQERTWNLFMGYVFHENTQFPNTIIFEISRMLKSKKPVISLLENTLYSFNFSVAPDLPFKTIFTKQVFGVSAGVFYPMGSRVFFKMTMGVRRELQTSKTNVLDENYLFYLTPSIAF